jgi:hypothetical protein
LRSEPERAAEPEVLSVRERVAEPARLSVLDRVAEPERSFLTVGAFCALSWRSDPRVVCRPDELDGLLEAREVGFVAFCGVAFRSLDGSADCFGAGRDAVRPDDERPVVSPRSLLRPRPDCAYASEVVATAKIRNATTAASRNAVCMCCFILLTAFS